MKKLSISILLLLGNVALANDISDAFWSYYYDGVNAASILLERPWQTKSSISQVIYKGMGWKYERPEPLKEPIHISDSQLQLTPIEKNYDLSSVHCEDGVQLRTGYSLDTNDVHFGEFSGMAIYPSKNSQGQEEMKLAAVSDRGNYWESSLSLNSSDHTLLGLKDNVLGSIKGLGKEEYDIEDVAVLNNTDGTLTYFISHEKIANKKTGDTIAPNQMSVYRNNFDDAANRTSYEPDEIKDCAHNKGIEALGLHPTLGAITIHEGNDGGKNLHPLYQWKDNDFSQDATACCLYENTDGFEVSGLTFLSDGTMLVLERWYQAQPGGMAEDYKIMVKSVSASTLKDALAKNDQTTQVIEGKQIIFIDKDAPGGVLYGLADNFECIAAIEHPAENGKQEISIFLLSDDNRAPFQRTIMLQFIADRKSLELKQK